MMSGESELAKKAVEDYLNIENFIKDNHKEIYEMIEEYDRNVGDKPEDDLLFIAEGLPFINGVVQVGSTHGKFQEAIKWVKDDKGISESGAVPVLTALTFIYIVEKKANDPSIPESEKKIWNRICRRVKKLSEGESQ